MPRQTSLYLEGVLLGSEIRLQFPFRMLIEPRELAAIVTACVEIGETSEGRLELR